MQCRPVISHLCTHRGPHPNAHPCTRSHPAANCDTSSHGYANAGAGGHRHARTSSNCHPVANLHSRPADANSYPDTYTGASDARAHSYTAYTDAHAHAHTRSALARSERDLP